MFLWNIIQYFLDNKSDRIMTGRKIIANPIGFLFLKNY